MVRWYATTAVASLALFALGVMPACTTPWQLQAFDPAQGVNYFHAENSFDMPIPAGHPTLAPRPSSMVEGMTCTSADYIADMRIAFPNGVAISASNTSYPFYQSTASDPLKTVECINKGADSKCVNISQPRGWDKVRIPTNAFPQEDYDHHMTVLDHSGKFLTDFYGMRRTVGPGGEVSWRAKAIARYERSGFGYRLYPDEADVPATKACRTSNYHGVIKYDELVVDHEIKHALSMGYRYPASNVVNHNNSVYPCERKYKHRKAEAAEGRPCMLPLGIRLQFDPTADPVQECAGVAAQFRNSCIVIIRAMQEYGIILTDGAGATVVTGENLAFHPDKSWADGAAEGYALNERGRKVFAGIDFFSKLRAVEPVRP